TRRPARAARAPWASGLRQIVCPQLIAALAIEAIALAARCGIGLVDPDDFGETLEAREESGGRRLEIDEHRCRSRVLVAVVDPDRRLRRESAVYSTVREKRDRRLEPQASVEGVGGRWVRRQDAYSTMLRERLRHQPRGDLQSVGDMRIEIDRCHIE